MTEQELRAIRERCDVMTREVAASDPRFVSAEVRQLIADLTALLGDLPVLASRESPTWADEPPWKGWFSCEDCGGWFNATPVCYDDAEELCASCAEKKDAEIAKRKVASRERQEGIPQQRLDEIDELLEALAQPPAIGETQHTDTIRISLATYCRELRNAYARITSVSDSPERLSAADKEHEQTAEWLRSRVHQERNPK